MLRLGKGILLITEALSFLSLSITAIALLAKQCPYVVLATPVVSLLAWPGQV